VDGNKWVSVNLTEPEAIKLITQATHYLGQIDGDKFNAKVSSPPSGVTLT